jgi:hypothetical protein
MAIVMQETLEEKITELMNVNDKLTFCEFLEKLLSGIKCPPKKLKRVFKVVMEIVDKGAPMLWVEMPTGTYVNRGVKEILRYETFIETEDSEDARKQGDIKISKHMCGSLEEQG